MKIILVLDEETTVRLTRLAEVCDSEPEAIAVSLLHDILEDDDVAHKEAGYHQH